MPFLFRRLKENTQKYSFFDFNGLNVETSTYDSVNMKANTVPESAKGLRMYHKLLLLNRKER